MVKLMVISLFEGIFAGRGHCMCICGPAQETGAYRPPALVALPATCWWEAGRQNRVDAASFKGKRAALLMLDADL